MNHDINDRTVRCEPTIRPIRDGEELACEQILRSLPDWFGIEVSLAGYVEATKRLPTWLAWVAAEPVGFITLHHHFPTASEIHCIAVAPNHHRQGIGRGLVQFAEDDLRRSKVRYLQVKTLGPSRPDAAYANTREFYAGLGFTPLEEFPDLWPGNPCLLLIKTL